MIAGVDIYREDETKIQNIRDSTKVSISLLLVFRVSITLKK